MTPAYPFRGRRPKWDTKPPPWAPRRSREWYLERARIPGAVIAAAEAAAAADTTSAPER